MLSAHKRRDKDLFLTKAILKVIEDNVKEKKWVKGHIEDGPTMLDFKDSQKVRNLKTFLTISKQT